MHEQLIRYEEVLRAYEAASGKEFSKDLVLATVLTGLREPLKSQVQFRMGPSTTYTELREWILQYEALNTPCSQKPSGGGGKYEDGGQQPMEVDRIWAGKNKGKDGKGKTKDGKGKYGKGKSKGKDGKGRRRTEKERAARAKTAKGTASGASGAPIPGTTRRLAVYVASVGTGSGSAHRQLGKAKAAGRGQRAK